MEQTGPHGQPRAHSQKGAVVDINETDHKLLSILIEDSRTSYSDLAKQVGLSRVAVKNRIVDMRRHGIIEKFTILVPSKFLGTPLPVFFDIGVAPQHIEEAAESVARYPDIAIVYQMSGSSGLHVHGFFTDIDRVYEFINGHLSQILGINSVKTEFLLRRYKVQRSLMV